MRDALETGQQHAMGNGGGGAQPSTAMAKAIKWHGDGVKYNACSGCVADLPAYLRMLC